MKGNIASSICLLLGFVSIAFTAPPAGQSYFLTWSDEFDGTALDTSNWRIVVGQGIGVELQYYTNGSNLTFENGSAVIWAKKEKYLYSPYTSCRLQTDGKRAFKYGYIEIRLKSPEGLGLWPSFWTEGISTLTAGWPDGGEIDLFNAITGPDGYKGQGDKAFQVECIFKDAKGVANYNLQKYQYSEKLSLQYHLYAIEWDSLKIQYYFDGQKFWEYDSINESYNFNSFHQPHFFTTNIVVGGAYQGYLVDTTIFPQKMYIDYVRVYQKSTSVINSQREHNLPDLSLINSGKSSLKLYDLQGRLLGEFSGLLRRIKQNGRFSITTTVASVPQGVYIARIYTGSHFINERLVINK